MPKIERAGRTWPDRSYLTHEEETYALDRQTARGRPRAGTVRTRRWEVIPVAAVARPRQGIRVPATGAPPLSAGTIAATAGDGQVTITETAPPQGGTGTITRQLEHSEDGVNGWASIPGATALPYTHSGTAVVNADTDHYRLAVSGGSSTVYTGVVSATPASAGGASTLLFAKDFGDGVWSPISTPGRGDPADYAVVEDPTGSGRGKMARIHYHRDSTSDGELDKNRAFTLNHITELVGSAGHTYGSRGYIKVDVYVPVGTRSGFGLQYDQRKLMYPKFGDWDNGSLRHDWSIILDGRVDGSAMDVRVVSGTQGSAGYADFREHAYGVAEFTYDTWHVLEMEWQLNDAGVNNAWLKVWLDGVLRKERTNFRMVDPHLNGLPRDYLYDFEVGDQQQGDTSIEVNNPSLFNAYRFFDNVVVRTAKP